MKLLHNFSHKKPKYVEDDLPADLPVMFWIHGGSFSGGYGEIGNDLARLGDAADVIVVAINYRVGPIGEARCSLF